MNLGITGSRTNTTFDFSPVFARQSSHSMRFWDGDASLRSSRAVLAGLTGRLKSALKD